MKHQSHRRENLAQGRTYSCGCVNSQHTLRLIECKEARLSNFVLMEELGIRPGMYGGINVTETVEENHDVSLSIDEAQENSTAFEEMGISK